MSVTARNAIFSFYMLDWFCLVSLQTYVNCQPKVSPILWPVQIPSYQQPQCWTCSMRARCNLLNYIKYVILWREIWYQGSIHECPLFYLNSKTKLKLKNINILKQNTIFPKIGFFVHYRFGENIILYKSTRSSFVHGHLIDNK